MYSRKEINFSPRIFSCMYWFCAGRAFRHGEKSDRVGGDARRGKSVLQQKGSNGGTCFFLSIQHASTGSG